MNVLGDSSELRIIADHVIEAFVLPEGIAGSLKCLMGTFRRDGFQTVQELWQGNMRSQQ